MERIIVPPRKRKAISVNGHRKKAKVAAFCKAEKRNTRRINVFKRVRPLKSFKCPRCGSLLFCSDPRSLCCGNTLRNPEILIHLPRVPLEWDGMFRSALFGQRCRRYNNYFAFSAIAATHGIERVPGGPSNLILHGKTYHRILPGQCPTGPLRFFLYDGLDTGDNENDLNPEWIKCLREKLAEVSPFWNKLKQLSSETAEFARLEITVTESREIAALIVLDPNEPVKPKTIVYWKRTDNKPVFISSKSDLYFPLQYVLIAPDDTPGWSVDYGKRNNITQLAFYRQLLMRQETLHLLGPLLNEYIVDIFSAVETDRLNFLRVHQKQVMKKGDLVNLRNDETIAADGDTKIGRVYSTLHQSFWVHRVISKSWLPTPLPLSSGMANRRTSLQCPVIQNGERSLITFY